MRRLRIPQLQSGECQSQNESVNLNDPNIDGIVKFKNGIFCAVQACDAREFSIFEMDCIGTKGRLNLTHSGFDCEFYEVEDSKQFSEHKEIFCSSLPIDLENYRGVTRRYMVNAVRCLVECLEKGEESVSSGKDGRAALELICAFHESAKADGKKISLPLMDSEVKVESK